MQEGGALSYSGLFNLLWIRMVDMVGVQTVVLLAQRAAWMTREKYNEAAAIHITDTGIDLNELEEAAGEFRARAITEEFLASLIEILTRLLGERITRKLAEELDDVLRKDVPDYA